MGGQPGHGVETGLKSTAGGAGGPLVGHQSGPEPIKDGADADTTGGVGTDPNKLEDANTLGRGPGVGQKGRCGGPRDP